MKSRLPDGSQNPAWQKRYREQNLADEKARMRAWRAAHPGYARLQGKDYREMVISLLRARDGHDCWVCGDIVLEGEDHIDHVKPRCRGGSHNAENLKLSHSWCNQRRSRK